MLVFYDFHVLCTCFMKLMNEMLDDIRHYVLLFTK